MKQEPQATPRHGRERALLMLDLTRDRVQADGARAVAGAQTAVRFAQGELAYFRARNRPIIHAITNSSVFSDNTSPKPSVGQDEQDKEPVAALAPVAGEHTLYKPADSAFFGTALDTLLRELGVKQLTLVGLETQTAVLATAIGAMARGYRVIVPDTCVVSNDPALHSAALQLIRAGASRSATALQGAGEPGATERVTEPADTAI